MEIKYHKKAIKFINSLQPKERQRIKDGISRLITAPESCDIKALEGYTDIYRLRIGQYRVIYTKDNVILFIADVGNRGDIYKKY
jgi:mRNA interferase RelE/StbE